MTAPVLTDLAGRSFTEGDYVVYSSVNGIRYGKVDWIKELPRSSYHRPGVDPDRYKVYVELSFHTALTKEPGKMYAKRVGYEYVAKHFLKVSEIEKSP